jgi:hypothetical protein
LALFGEKGKKKQKKMRKNEKEIREKDETPVPWWDCYICPHEIRLRPPDRTNRGL